MQLIILIIGLSPLLVQYRLVHAGPKPASWNATCILVFGDSTVDPGNNNRLGTDFKANFLPYGKDFLNGRPTGRFCNGRLATDFIAETLGVSSSVPAFLDPNLSTEQLKHGVSFASASSGYDELTATNAGVLSFPKQLEYFRHYNYHLQKQIGPIETKKIMSDALVIISAGSNDFLENYYFYDNRSKEFTEHQYQDYLVSLMSESVKEISRIGVRRFILVGLPPIGCVPIVKTLSGSDGCIEKYNQVAASFNSKIVAQLPVLKKQLSVRPYYLDTFQLVQDATMNADKYGFEETAKGCCGTGMIEIGETCKGQSTCIDANRYMYWDAIHPTQKMNKIIADEAIKRLANEVFG